MFWKARKKKQGHEPEQSGKQKTKNNINYVKC